VAFKKQIFGEGTEQFTHQFFEIEQDECSVVGDALVAKQSRFVEDLLPNYQSEADRDKFVKKFCTKQHQARTVAEAFNRRLDELNSLDPATPRICFLDTSVYYLYGKNKESCAVLVEDMLVGKFQKWNGNNGVRFLFCFDPRCIGVLVYVVLDLCTMKEELSLCVLTGL